MKNKDKIIVFVFILFTIFTTFFLYGLSNFEYPLAGDGEDHWRIAQFIQKDESLLSYNNMFPQAPMFYPQGYHSLFVAISNLTGISLQQIFLFLPLILFLFFYCSLYIFTKQITKNSIIACLSGFLLFFYWQNNSRHLYNFIIYIFAMPETLNMFISLLIISLIFKFKDIKGGIYYLIAILVLASSFIHIMTSVVLFLFISLVFLFNLIKRNKKLVIKTLFLLFLLFLGWIIQFLPILLDNGFPDATRHILPTSIEDQSSTFSTILSSKINNVYSFFIIRPFDENVGSPLVYIFILSFILGLIIFLKDKMFNYTNLPYFILPFILIVNKLTFDIKVFNDLVYFLFVPVAYFLFAGIGLYYIWLNLNKIKGFILAALLIILVLVSLLILINDFSNKNTPILQTNKYVGISDESIAFLNNIPDNSTIVASSLTSKTLAVITSKQVLITANKHYGMYVWQTYDIPQRKKDIKQIYESCDFNETKELMEKYNQEIYIYVGKYEGLEYGICYNKFGASFNKKEFDRDSIYYLV